MKSSSSIDAAADGQLAGACIALPEKELSSSYAEPPRSFMRGIPTMVVAINSRILTCVPSHAMDEGRGTHGFNAAVFISLAEKEIPGATAGKMCPFVCWIICTDMSLL